MPENPPPVTIDFVGRDASGTSTINSMAAALDKLGEKLKTVATLSQAEIRPKVFTGRYTGDPDDIGRVTPLTVQKERKQGIKASEGLKGREARVNTDLRQRREIHESLVAAGELEAKGEPQAAVAASEIAKEKQIALQLQKQLKLSESESLAEAQKLIAANKAISAEKERQRKETKEQTDEEKKKENIFQRLRRAAATIAGREIAGRSGGMLGGIASSISPAVGSGLGVAAIVVKQLYNSEQRTQSYFNKVEDEIRADDNMGRHISRSDRHGSLAIAEGLTDQIDIKKREIQQQFQPGDANAVPPVTWLWSKTKEIGRDIFNGSSLMFGADGSYDPEYQANLSVKTKEINKERAIRRSLKLGQQEIDVERLEKGGQHDAAAKLQRQNDLDNEKYAIESQKLKDPEMTLKLKDQAVERDRLKYLMAPSMSVGDSLTAVGGGGGVFTPQADGSGRDQMLLDENKEQTSKLGEILNAIISTATGAMHFQQT